MKQILVEGMTGNKGGKETFIINVYQKLLESKEYAFTFIAYDETIAYEDYLTSTGAAVVHLPPRNEGLLRHLAAMVGLFKKKHFDVVWSHKTTLSACELLFISKLFGVKKRIVHSHSSANMGGRFTFIMHLLNRRLLPLWVTDCLACSESAANWFYRNNDYVIIKNGIDVEKFRFDPAVRNSVRESLGIKDSFVVGHIGRFGLEKNHKKLINVFDEVLKVQPNAILVLCGDGEERGNIENQIKALGIVDKVLLLGMIDNVHQVLQAMDIFVMPSFFEGLPFSLLEAQTTGLRCVISDTVSYESDILGVNLFLSLDNDDCNWANAVLEPCEISREHAYSIIRQNGYDINNTIQSIISLLNSNNRTVLRGE